MATAAEVRSGLDHPVIDADGHGIEYLPWFRDLLRDEGGPGAVDAWDVVEHGARLTRGLDAAAKRALGLFRVSWWGLPTESTLDRASAMLPALLHERLDELGIDVAVCYPTYGLTVMGLDDPHLRVAAARAFNTYYAQAYAGSRDRLEPVAIVPTYAPDEAIEVLEHAVATLGLRAVMCTGLVGRPLPGENLPRGARWLDALGLDSEYDYDPLWQRFVDLDVTPTFHSTGMGWGSRTSPTSYVANHVGSFAAAGEALCRSLVLGGVMQRFPGLRFAFLEGGVAWAATLCSDLVGHFEKRHSDVIHRYDPARLDRDALAGFVERYGGPEVKARVQELDAALHMLSEPDEDPAQLDEFARSGLRSPAEIRATFARQCFFGCEADDPTWALAYAPEYHGTRLGAMFASDLGHWDVPDATRVLPEAWELVERGLVTTDEAFTLAHPARVRSLTLSNTVGGLWTDALLAHFATFLSGAAAPEEVRLGVHSALGPSFVVRDPARAFLYQQLNTFHDPPMAAVARALTGTRVEHAALDATGVPVFVITGTDDALFPAPLVLESAAMLTAATTVEVADAGHSPYFERPDDYNAALLTFLARIS